MSTVMVNAMGFQLSRRGIAIFALGVGVMIGGALGAATMFTLSTVQIKEARAQHQALLEMQAPRDARLKTLEAQTASLHTQIEGQAQQMMELKNAARLLAMASVESSDAAKRIPELRTPNYKEPFDLLVVKLTKGRSIAEKVLIDAAPAPQNEVKP